ncbi:protein KINESIN LIGHT CHAIN-RELATED 1-like [Zingiber officinale]|uniref:protein KINESIN LIGHT CHAIN-RELATED 1-like n=1 Tax=Zingiber officinale TaxID=94328 RepID=UPI001C4D0000|nr:protein KINESIN LIGHT CHAIN-RELATED 1-like [Zingiber officinale]
MQGFLRVEVGTNEMPCNFIASDVKENLSTPMSSRIPSMDSFMAEAMEFQTDGVREPSIEKLYYNVCELEGSYDGSVSWQSYGSDSEESRIDSELCHLVGGQAIRAIEAQEDRNITNVVARAKNRPTEKKLESNLKSLSTNTSSGSSKKLKRPPQLRHNPDKYLKSEVTKKNGLRSPQKDDKTVENRGYVVGHMKKQNKHPTKEANSDTGSDDLSEGRLDNPDLGPFLLKHAKDLIASNNQEKALKYALRAAKSFQKCTGVKPSLDLVMSLHVVAAIYCNLGKFAEAVPVLQQSVKIPVPEESQEHALAKFSGYMQLGDTYAMLGLLESSIYCYEDGLEIQRQALGDMDPRVGETCRYLAEAHVQALQFEQAERLCQKALDIHKANGETTSVEEAADRRLMALIYDTKGDHEAALEHLVLASMGLVSNGQETEVASVDISIGDIYLSLARYEEAVFAYRKALTAFKASKGENHPAVASVFVRLADLHNRIGKFGESKCYCESALRIYNKPIPGSSSEEIATGFTNVSSIFESMNENEQALKLLQKAVKMYKNCPGQQSTIAGIEAQIGVLHYIIGNYEESYLSLENAITKLRACGEKKSAFFGVVLNQMGLACIQSFAISEAAKFFDEARSILEQECGPYHLDTLGVYSNLAGAYDAMGRFDEAIEILKYVVGLREEKLGTASPDVSDEKRRLAELLKENGRVRNRKSRSLETLFDKNAFGKKKAVASAV